MPASLRRAVFPALLVGFLCAAVSVAQSPVIPAGPQQPITPKIDVPTPTPAVIPTPDDLDVGLVISATLDGEPVDANPITMEPGQLLVLTLTGEAAKVSDTNAPRLADWTLNREAKGLRYHDDSRCCLSFTATAKQADAYLFTAAVNGTERPALATRWVVVSGKGPQPPPVVVPDEPDVPDPVKPEPPPTVTATSATYVYEKDIASIPSAVSAALNRLNREQKIIATVFERDSRTGDGDVPAQYKPLIESARSAGLPALVVMAGDKVLRTVKDPKTEDAVMEAVK